MAGSVSLSSQTSRVDRSHSENRFCVAVSSVRPSEVMLAQRTASDAIHRSAKTPQRGLVTVLRRVT